MSPFIGKWEGRRIRKEALVVMVVIKSEEVEVVVMWVQ